MKFILLIFLFVLAGFISAEGNETGKAVAAIAQNNYILLIVGLVIIITFLFLMLLKLNRNKIRKEKLLEITNKELNKTQNQLVHHEKMASLGRLLAGIVHEIQNPLNFINNFSEITSDLLEEYESTENAEEKKDLLKQITENINKINLHGKRADSIIKSMLHHSREKDIEKQATDINQLTSEYLSFAYSGYRAINKDITVKLEKKLHPSLPEIKIARQNLSRVLINLFNNSLDAIHQKVTTNTNGYKPELLLETSYSGSKIFIIIKDNGSGISENIKDKIFDPFFTTKPAGAGTGLGLSISNDIVLAHGGKITVNTEDKNYTEFTIELPISN